MRFARPAAAAAGSALLAAAVSGAGAVAPAVGTAAGSAGSLAAIVSVRPGIVHALAAQPVPPTTAFCERRFKIACYLPRQIQRAYHLPALFRKGVDGKGQTIVIVDSFGSPTVRRDLSGVRRRGRPAGAALAAGHPAGREGTPLPSDLEPGGLGRRDRPGRRVRPHDGAGRPDPARRDPDLGERGHDRVSADRQGRGVRDQSPPRRRDQPELQRHRADLPVPEIADRSARRLPRRGPARGDRARRLGRQRRRRREVQPGHLLPAPGDVMAGQRPAGHRRRRHPAASHRGRPAYPARHRLERHLQRADEPVHRRQPGAGAAGGRRRQVGHLPPSRVTRMACGPSSAAAAACRTSR